MTSRRLGVLLAATAVAAATLLAALPSGAEETTPDDSTTTSTTLAAPTPPPTETPPADTPPEPSFSAAAEVEAAATGVTLSKSSGLDPDGEAITVDATGFTFGQGYYVMFCTSTGGTIGTSGGRPTGAACDSSKQYWTNNPSGGTPVAADGSFSTTISPVVSWGSVDCSTDTCGFFVRKDHTAGSDYSHDTFVPVTFADPAPTVTLSKSTDLDPDGEAITVDATGFTFGQGYYVMFCTSTGNPTGDAAGRPTGTACDSSKQYWTNNPSGGIPVAADGSFSTTISPVAAFNSVDCFTDTCGFFVRKDHTAGSDYSQDTFVPVTFADPESAGPSISLSKSTDLDPDGEAITVNGSGFTPSIGVYVRVCKEASGDLGTSGGRPTGTDCDAPKDVWVDDIGGDGAFSTTISPVAQFESIDCTIDTCGIFVRHDHVAPTDYSQDAFAAIAFGDGGSGPDPDPGETEEPGGTVTGDLVPGGTATATVWGFAPLSSVDAELHSTPQAIGSYQSGANGTASITFTIPTDLVGDHEFVASGIDAEGNPLTVRVPFTIAIALVADNFTASGGLAFTGSDTTDLLVIAAAAGLTGLGVVLLTRRRRQPTLD